MADAAKFMQKRKITLSDAQKMILRAYLRSWERNHPKTQRGGFRHCGQFFRFT